MAGALHGFAYSAQSLAFLKTIQPKLRRQIVKRVEALASEAYPHNCKVVQNKMDGEDKVYRIRSGDYRILYVVRDNPSQIIVLDIGHRKDVYR